MVVAGIQLTTETKRGGEVTRKWKMDPASRSISSFRGGETEGALEITNRR
jgi:hypothetical protein